MTRKFFQGSLGGDYPEANTNVSLKAFSFARAVENAVENASEKTVKIAEAVEKGAETVEKIASATEHILKEQSAPEPEAVPTFAPEPEPVVQPQTQTVTLAASVPAPQIFMFPGEMRFEIIIRPLPTPRA